MHARAPRPGWTCSGAELPAEKPEPSQPVDDQVKWTLLKDGNLRGKGKYLKPSAKPKP